jgi:hypothetical protein
VLWPGGVRKLQTESSENNHQYETSIFVSVKWVIMQFELICFGSNAYFWRKSSYNFCPCASKREQTWANASNRETMQANASKHLSFFSLYFKQFLANTIYLLSLHAYTQICVVCLFARVPYRILWSIHRFPNLRATMESYGSPRNASVTPSRRQRLIPSSRCHQHRANSSASQSFVWFTCL